MRQTLLLFPEWQKLENWVTYKNTVERDDNSLMKEALKLMDRTK